MRGHVRRIYLLSPRSLSPETIAVAFAKTSRSPESFDTIASGLSDEASAQFHERWVVGYGHASVAEHAVLHIAMENISRLAIECVESNRLASYTEKSTRYQTWDRTAYVVPAEVRGTHHEELYRRTCELLLDTYLGAIEPLRRVAQSAYPRQPEESEARWEGRIRSRYIDVARYLLPSAVFANVGLTLNARALEHAIRKMLSHPLQEVRDIGEEARTVAQGEVPTLVRYAEASPFLQRQGQIAPIPASEGPRAGRDNELTGPAGAVFLRHAEPLSEARAMAAAAVRRRGISYAAALSELEASPEAAREAARRLLADRGEWDNAPRELEHITYTVEVLADQGAYFEAKRHRMLSLTSAPLSTRLGFTTPRWFAESGLGESYRRAMDSARDAYEELARENPLVAGYLVPNGYLRRFVMTLNLREAFHLCELRARPNAHFAMRVVALHLAELVRGVHPLLGSAMRLEGLPTWSLVEAENFISS
jgi:thymidylate synthase ThyX